MVVVRADRARPGGRHQGRQGDVPADLRRPAAQPARHSRAVRRAGARRRSVLSPPCAYLLRRVPQSYSGCLATVLGSASSARSCAGPPRARPFPLANQLQGTLNLATPLILGALGGVLCERSGVINIAIEGQFLVGAFAAAVVAELDGQRRTLGLIAAAVPACWWPALLAVFAIKYRVNQIVLGVVLNVLVSGSPASCSTSCLQPNADDAEHAARAAADRDPGALATSRSSGRSCSTRPILVYLMYVAVAVVTFVLFQTRWGLRVRAVGEHPKAADTVGIKVNRIRYSGGPARRRARRPRRCVLHGRVRPVRSART